jgi:WD40 repeat protein
MSLSVLRSALFLLVLAFASLPLTAQALVSPAEGLPTVRQIAEFHGYSGPSLLRGRPAMVAISPDNSLVAISANNRSVNIFDTSTGQLKFTLAVDNGINGFAFSPDGKTFATRDTLDKSVRLWDATSGKQLRQFPGRKRNLETKGKSPRGVEDLRNLVFSPDGRIVLTEREDDVVSVWNVDDGKEVMQLRHDTQSNAAVDILSKVFFTSSSFGLMLRAQYSPDGRRIITANGDNTPKLWDAATGKLIAALEAHRDRVYAASFSSNGTTIATIGFDGNAVLWDSETGRRKLVFQTGEKGLANLGAGMVLSRNELTAVTFKGADTTVWDATTGHARFKLRKGKANIALISRDGKTIVTAGEDKKATATFWDVETGQQRMALPPAGDTTDFAAFSPDGRLLVTASDKGVRLWNASDGRLLATMVHARYPVAFSQDGAYMITGGTDDTAALYQVERPR